MRSQQVARRANGCSMAPSPPIARLLFLAVAAWFCVSSAGATPVADTAQPTAQQLPAAPPPAAAEPAKPVPPKDSAATPKKAESPQPAKAAPMKDPASLPEASEADLRDIWGIEVLSLRRTAGDFMIDFRYRVHDPEKAAPLFVGQIHPYIIDEATGGKFIVPDPPKVGQLRTTRKPVAGKNYFMIFANPGQQMKSGNKITVIVGDLKIAHLTLE